MPVLRKKFATIGALLMLALAFQAQASVNKSVKVPDGGQADGASSVNGSVTVGTYATISGDLSTVNGSVRVGEGSTIQDAETVNGSLRIGDGVNARNLETVNGKIRVGANAVIEGGVSAVNGSIEVAQASTVARDLSNVNGEITLEGSQVSGDVTTVNGDVNVVDGAVIRGDLVIKKPGGWNWNKDRKPTVIIGPGSRVQGVIRAEREIKLFISESAEVGGVEGEAKAETFSGRRP
ncbi:MAG: hypothetical protein QNJ00_07750 [Woeseiaceae bacterium]|nr:hypothetical protein [Woeseiaceae bacterium]